MTSSAAPNDHAREHHAVVTGTGRAGTTFLVRFLGACGLDVGSGQVFERARAGHEHLLAPGAPYVVKDPTLAFYCDDIDMRGIAVDALILPVRDLMDAAESRVYQEVLHTADHPRGRWPNAATAHVVGGMIWPLEPLDQARILATIQYRIIQWAARNELPLYLLDFPRFVEDEQYLLDRLWPWLARHCDRERAGAAFTSTAEPASVRFREQSLPLTPDGAAVALRAAVDQLDELRNERVELTLERDTAQSERDAARDQRDAAGVERDIAIRERDDARTSLRATIEARDRAVAERDMMAEERQLIAAERDAASAHARAMERTRSWRMTRPLRALHRRTHGTTE